LENRVLYELFMIMSSMLTRCGQRPCRQSQAGVGT